MLFASVLALSALEAAGSGPYGSGPGGPILVVTNATNPFSTYYAEILLNEGLNEFALTNVSSIGPAALSNYDVVILGETALTAGQVTTLSNWVSGGGNLIAMKPDRRLTNLLGITFAGSTLSEGYLLVNSASGPGAGIVGETIQFHGTADRYTLNGASSLATLYSNASTATPNPAVTLRSVGANGGQAAAFTFDLARSIVLTRQGNPAWVNQDRDNNAPVRPNDLFFGAKAGDMQPDWVNLNKVAIPQADEQQRLLANMILSMNSDRKLLPRFWYFPKGHQAVVVMTADNHGSGDAAARFDQQLAASPTGGSVDDWETIRSSAYLFLGEDLTKTGKSADEYNTNGFEIGLHINTVCANYTSESLEAYFTNQLGQFSQLYPNLPPPTTHRLHCIAWSDYTTLPQMESKYGIRLDANYYYYPQAWVNNRPGMFTGSGMAMRFAKTTGEVIDVYQAATQMTDESGQSYPYTIDTLLDRALGPEGYYGAFVANMHTDADATHPSSVWSSNIVNSAIARGVPVISARQMLTWLDARNQSSISSLNWSNNLLTFSVAADSNARGLQAIVPILAGDTVSEVRRGVELVAYSLKWIKGVHYAAFPALSGNYTITYADDATPPTVASVNPTNEAVGVSLGTRVTVTFSEAMDPVTITNGITLSNSSGGLVASTVAYNASAFSATLTPNSPLALSTVYTVVVANGATGVKDVAGNALTNVFTASFTMANPAGFTIWDDSTVPAVLIQYDPNEVELGVKFQSALDGYVTGIRFYKGPANVGTHVGNLWTSAGTLLGSVTFVNETSSGWQYQALTNPVPISSNTTYVVSYHAPAGGYSVDPNYFGASGVDRYPLRALANGEDGGNGVYAYGASAFPAQTYNANNYWVDVVVKAPVKIASGVVADSKVYSGTAMATLHTNDPVVLSGVLGSDSVSLLTNGYVASFASLHVSNTIPVTVNGLHLGGRDAGNYLLVQPTILAADITPATLTVSGLAAQNKTYDGTTTATLNTGGATLVGVVSGDLVTLSTPAATGAFADPGVGNDKLITVSGLALSGGDAPNYFLTQPTTTASITPATVTPSVTVVGKPYDGTTAATITDRS